MSGEKRNAIASAARKRRDVSDVFRVTQIQRGPCGKYLAADARGISNCLLIAQWERQMSQTPYAVAA